MNVGIEFAIERLKDIENICMNNYQKNRGWDIFGNVYEEIGTLAESAKYELMKIPNNSGGHNRNLFIQG